MSTEKEALQSVQGRLCYLGRDLAPSVSRGPTLGYAYWLPDPNQPTFFFDGNA